MIITRTKHRKVAIAVDREDDIVRIRLSEYQGAIYDDNRRTWSHDVIGLTPDELRAIVRHLERK